MNRSQDNTALKAAEELGNKLREVRTARGWTLAEASERIGLSTSSLSKIENGRMSLTFEVLIRLTEVLDVDLAELLGTVASGPGPGGRRSITRAGEGYEVETERYLHRYLAAELLQKRVIPVVSEVRARTLEEYGPMSEHGVDEFSFVLSGKVMLHTDLYAPTLLEQGDSVYLDARVRHAYLAVSDEPCRMLSVTSAISHRPQSQGDVGDVPLEGLHLYGPA